MEDQLKKIIADHRAHFDRNVPDSGVWEAVRRQLPGVQATGKSESREGDELMGGEQRGGRSLRKLKLWKGWAAAVLLLLGCLSVYYFQTIRPSLQLGGVEEVSRLFPPVSPSLPGSPSPTSPSSSSSALPSSASAGSVPGKEGAPNAGIAAPAPTNRAEHSKEVADASLTTRTDARLTTRTDGPVFVNPVAAISAFPSAQGSASERLQYVLDLEARDEMTEAQVETLLQIINEDPSVNVRAAALNALASRISPDRVEAMVQDVFVRQDDPSLQLRLLWAMLSDDTLQLQDSTAMHLIAITEDPFVLDLVKQQAYAVLLKHF